MIPSWLTLSGICSSGFRATNLSWQGPTPSREGLWVRVSPGLSCALDLSLPLPVTIVPKLRVRTAPSARGYKASGWWWQLSNKWSCPGSHVCPFVHLPGGIHLQNRKNPVPIKKNLFALVTCESEALCTCSLAVLILAGPGMPQRQDFSGLFRGPWVLGPFVSVKVTYSTWAAYGTAWQRSSQTITLQPVLRTDHSVLTLSFLGVEFRGCMAVEITSCKELVNAVLT